jgi:hypothetical protein
MSTVYTNIKNKKLTVETSNTKSLTTRRVVGRWWQSLNQQNYYKSAAYATKNLTDDVAHKPKCNTHYYMYITAIW